MKIVESKSNQSQINLTPLIDVLFLLIIFFAVSTQFTNQRSIGVDLPESKTSSQISTAQKLIIIMRDEDSVFLNGSMIRMNQLDEALKNDNFDRQQKVILNIDKKISHGAVIHLLDILKLNAFKKVVFGTYGNP